MSWCVERPLLDLDSVDLDRAERVCYLLRQRFRYDYDAPAYDVHQRLVAVPRARHGGLRRCAHRVDVEVDGAPSPAPVLARPDRRGNLVVRVALPVVATSVEFTVTATVERVEDAAAASDRPAPWAFAAFHPVRATRLTAADGALRAVAAELRATASDDVAFADAVCARVATGLRYEFDATSVATTAAEAWALGRGVCQDAAHVMLAICRSAGVPARYVSGHLLGQPGGSHAWVEVLVTGPGGPRVIGFDPSGGYPVGPRHLPVAVGRDYADVAPTSGRYAGVARGRLTTTKHAGVVAVEHS